MVKILSYGGGTNSTALLVGLSRTNVRPDAILFADTGGEKDETYAYIDVMQAYLKSIDFPEITILKGPKYWTPQMIKDGSLENQCLRLGALPSKAFGGSTCSVKWKVEPMERFIKQYMHDKGLRWKSQILRFIGFDYGEPQRVIRAKKREKERQLNYEDSFFLPVPFI